MCQWRLEDIPFASITPKSPGCKESVRKSQTDFNGLREMLSRESPTDAPLKDGNMTEVIPEILFELFEFCPISRKSSQHLILCHYTSEELDYF